MDSQPLPGQAAWSYHLAQMAHDHWWMGIESSGKYFRLNITVQDGRLYVHLSDQGEGQEDVEWEGDHREKPPFCVMRSPRW